jgi:ADP-ribosylglycohydrolase
VGTVTDDTQLTMCVGESLCALGRLEPEDLARRFVRWGPDARGPGATTLQAVRALAGGEPWDRAGVDSAGNGAAMRVAPIALFHPVALERLRYDAAVSAVITHANQMAVASAIAQAFMVAWCVHRRPGELTGDSLRSELLAGLMVALEGVGESEVRERREDHPTTTRLRDRLVEAFEMRFSSPADAFDHFHNGAFVLETLPAALWCFLRFWDDPRQAILTAVQGGYDADTVASLAGTLIGALHGDGALPAPWIEELEYADELRGLADSLLALARLSPIPDGGTSGGGAAPLSKDSPDSPRRTGE